MKALALCSLKRWNTLCQKLGLSADGGTYGELIAVHGEKHRAYHTLDHISACLTHLDSVREQILYPAEVEMALWFHDAVYEPFSASNEEDSAEWAADWLQDRGASKAVIARIADHILTTKNHHSPKNTDGQFMLDIDLAILGTSPDIYDIFEQNIRREYKRVPRFIFKKKRKEILEKFLSRDAIYTTDFFHAKCETQARQNLVRTISQL